MGKYFYWLGSSEANRIKHRQFLFLQIFNIKLCFPEVDELFPVWLTSSDYGETNTFLVVDATFFRTAFACNQ